MGTVYRILKNTTKNFQTFFYLTVCIFCGLNFYYWNHQIVSDIPSLELREDIYRNGLIVEAPVSNETELPNAVKNPIVPLSAVEVNPSTDANRTLKWLDLWGNDENCTKFNVTLLADETIKPRALVSFPGSGNTWLRMLLMGVTGIYINSVYGGDDALFESKGTPLN